MPLSARKGPFPETCLDHIVTCDRTVEPVQQGCLAPVRADSRLTRPCFRSGFPGSIHAQTATDATDATLSALTVDGVSVPGFHAERAEHAFGVANGTASPTILATPTDAGAAVAYAPADAAGTTDGYQVAVSPGATVTVTITVTAAGGATQNYELTIGRGLTGDFQWKAVDDFYTPAHADVTFYRDIWSDGEIMYLAAPDSDNKRILAFNMDTKEIIPGRQLDLATLTPGHGTNRSPQGVWGHNGMLWVFDAVANSPRIFAFTWNDASETWEYTSSRDITATVHLTSNRARGIWSDGETIWVSHPGLLENDRRLYAYDLTSGSRVPANDYDVWEAAGVETSAGIWSDGETMWVVAKGTPSKVYAFDTFTKEHAPEKDISATNLRGDVRGIWSDGRTLWLSSKVGDHVYIHSYHMPVSANAQLTHLRVDGELVAGFAPDTTSYTVEVEPGVTVVTVAAATRHFQGDAVIASPADANSAMDGHQVPIPAEGAVVTITATAQDGTTATYTLNLRPRALSGDAALTALTVSSATLQPLFDGATEEYAAALGAGVRTVTVTATRSDGRASVEFLDDHDRSLSLVGGDEGVATHQFTLPIRGNAIKVRVESEDGTQHQTYRIALSYPPTAPANVEIQSGDRFLAVSWEAPSDRGTSPINSFDLRYIRSDASSKDDQHWTTLPNVWNRTTAGPWRYELASLQNGVSYDVQVRAVSAGNGAWSASRSATPSPPAGDDASLKALTIDSASAPAFSPASRSYIVGVSGSSSRVTLAATATHPNARISLGTGTDAVDADPALAGHQVLLPRDEAAEKTVTIAVTAADGVTTADYRVTVIRNSSVATGWRAEADLNVLAGNGVNKPTGIWADETLVWIADGEDARVYAFELPTGRRARIGTSNCIKTTKILPVSGPTTTPRCGWWTLSPTRSSVTTSNRLRTSARPLWAPPSPSPGGSGAIAIACSSEISPPPLSSSIRGCREAKERRLSPLIPARASPLAVVTLSCAASGQTTPRSGWQTVLHQTVRLQPIGSHARLKQGLSICFRQCTSNRAVVGRRDHVGCG